MRSFLEVRKVLVLLLMIGVFATSCKTSKQTTSAGKETNLSEESKTKLMYFFVNANKEKILGNEGRAAELFAECLKIDPRNDASLYEMAQLYANRKKYAEALNFAKSASSINPKNEWYKQLLAEIYQRTNQWNEAALIYQNLTAEFPQRIDFYYQWAYALVNASKLNDALKAFDKIESIVGPDKEITLRKEQIYLKQNKVDKAAEVLENYISSNPESMDMYSLLYELYSANNMPDKALSVIDRMKAVNPNEPRIYLNLADYYRNKGDKEKSFENLQKAFTNRDLDTDIKVKIISSYIPLLQRDSSMMLQCMELCKTLAETHPDESRAQAIYGDLLTMNKDYSQAVSFYRKALDLDKDNLNVWQQYVINLSELKDFHAMDTASAEAIGLFPNESSLYLLNGIAKSQRNLPADAINILNQGVKLVVDNNQQLIQFYSNLGDCYNKTKEYSASDSSFDKALEIDPNEPFVLNNYAYYLSVRKEKLEQAEKMSKHSNELQPNQSSFLDTYGWILYQEGKYDEAKKWIEKAMENGGENSGTILEHYGDILFKLNQSDKAFEYWKKAKQSGDASGLLDQKIRDKKLYE
ncbi:MAG: tetratricopeptide repeat protein [Bacteroidia bacterium]|nr:tetratricopeptide repeat protein [Bacteroidia bacterium]OQB59550.1 MAG: tetratricopeptide repeat protein [Bacteroidetes bacterium ADurb.Bin141]MBP7713796.1 tetratricopeptide repeat protein [Bacteroidia bacterium]HQW17862.1 tetratricopeptide repeat protein [Bacteroidia bacterium]HQW49181.1 tetratricopeptide repeat protein [Bacteroidia bacterium]